MTTENNRWLAVTAVQIIALLEGPDEDNLVGRYLNEAKAVIGRERFMHWLKAYGAFGLTEYRRLKLQREAAAEGVA